MISKETLHTHNIQYFELFLMKPYFTYIKPFIKVFLHIGICNKIIYLLYVYGQSIFIKVMTEKAVFTHLQEVKT